MTGKILDGKGTATSAGTFGLRIVGDHKGTLDHFLDVINFGSSNQFQRGLVDDDPRSVGIGRRKDVVFVREQFVVQFELVGESRTSSRIDEHSQEHFVRRFLSFLQ